jgi:hypothetical protein
MRLDRATRTEVVVTLSRRNLLTLLAKLDGHPSNSACTILLPGGGEGPELLVRAEENDAHYQTRPEPPGPMHPDTEARMTAARR